MYFVCGIHGAGKTTYCKILQKKFGLACYTAGDIIARYKQNHLNKQVNDVDGRQNLLIKEIKILNDTTSNYILDGHLCLINENRMIERIKMDVFLQFGITKIWVITANPAEIAVRLKKRDNIMWDVQFVRQFQEEEVRYANEIGKVLNVEIVKMDMSSQKKNNIVLPIKPEYVVKILNGTKKYEFRKKLCLRDIDKIYLYATAPIKRIVGEAQVIEKLSLEKEKLWEYTGNYSGISHEAYETYFSNQHSAKAYEIGKVMKYAEGIELREIGISCVPQSFMYVGTI